jgi:hypothetical protein
MSDFFASGRAVDVVLAVLAIEMLLVALLGGRKRQTLLLALLPGLFLLLALRAAITDAPWPFIALFLALSLPAHLLDMRRRLG